MIQLGATYRDAITGFTGVAVGYVEYLTGCNQALLVPKTCDPSKRPESEWFDVQRLDQQDADIISLNNGSNPGCDKAAPII